jgi:hypothetical protein
VATALDFDEKAVQKVITNLDDLKKELPGVVARCLAFFPGVDRTVGGYEGLIAAQDFAVDILNGDAHCGIGLGEFSASSVTWLIAFELKANHPDVSARFVLNVPVKILVLWVSDIHRYVLVGKYIATVLRVIIYAALVAANLIPT